MHCYGVLCCVVKWYRCHEVLWGSMCWYVVVCSAMDCYRVYGMLMWYYKELWNVIGCHGVLWGGLWWYMVLWVV